MFKPGIEVFARHRQPKKFRVAAVTNFTGRDRKGKHLVNILSEHESFELTRIFTPEHGFSSDAPDGEHVADSRHAELEVPVISLYGNHKKPAPELLHDLDLLIYDIQDVGVRFYTYISTLRNLLDSAAESSIPVWILDRPDILGGVEVEGPMLEPEYSSFVGHLPVPVRYGLTPGELGLWWKNFAGLKLELKVWQCEDYVCSNACPAPDFPWFKPSPSMPDIATAQFYPGTCLFEGTNLSEGRGTEAPFRIIGAPDIDAEAWCGLARELLPGEIEISTCEFRPTFSKFENESCRGIKLSTQLPMVKNAVMVGIRVLYAFFHTNPGKLEFTERPGLKHPFFDYLCGTDLVRKSLTAGDKADDIYLCCNSGVEEFRKAREEFFLYPRR